MYAWRNMSKSMRREVLALRQRQGVPWHSPPHRNSDRTNAYLFTSACFEHQPVIGNSPERMAAFEERLLKTAESVCAQIVAWVVLPNHYHFLAHTNDAIAVLRTLGQLHGRTSFEWNGEDDARGRRVWFNSAETAMKSDGHFQVTVNYVHHNPVKHGYVERWQDWPFSSAAAWLELVGRDEAESLWRGYPIGEYGKGWDE